MEDIYAVCKYYHRVVIDSSDRTDVVNPNGITAIYGSVFPSMVSPENFNME